jgi:hypothetical protein
MCSSRRSSWAGKALISSAVPVRTQTRKSGVEQFAVRRLRETGLEVLLEGQKVGQVADHVVTRLADLVDELLRLFAHTGMVIHTDRDPPRTGPPRQYLGRELVLDHGSVVRPVHVEREVEPPQQLHLGGAQRRVVPAGSFQPETSSSRTLANRGHTLDWFWSTSPDRSG